MARMTMIQALRCRDGRDARARRQRGRARRGRRQVRRRVPRAPSGLYEEFGAERVIDTPLAEAGIIGTAIGMALYGLRPVPEIQFADFIYPGVRSDRERAGQVPLPLGRPVPVPGGDPHAVRRRHPRRPLPLAVARGAVHPHARPQGRAAVEPVRRQGPAARVDARERPGALHGAQAASTAPPRARCPRATTRSSSLGEGRGSRAPGDAGDGARVGRDGADYARWRRRRGGRRQTGLDVEVVDLRTLLPLDTRRDPRVGEEDRPLRDRARGAAHLRLRRRADRADARSARIEHLEAPILRVTGFDTPFPYTLEHEYTARRRIASPPRSGAVAGVLSDGRFEFKLPDIGEGVVEGEIVAWQVKAGDAVDEDQPMVEVMTDKATVEIPSPAPAPSRRSAARSGRRCRSARS